MGVSVIEDVLFHTVIFASLFFFRCLCCIVGVVVVGQWCWVTFNAGASTNSDNSRARAVGAGKIVWAFLLFPITSL